MQMALHLFPEAPIRLEFSYYPKLAAAVYQAISHADPDFAYDLHDGELHRNRIKLFGFSPLYSRQTEIHPENTTQNISGGLVFKRTCSFTVCSPWPELINRLGEGFLRTSQLRIGSQVIRIHKTMLSPMPDLKEKMIWHFRQPASCVTSWSSKNKNKKRYVLPGIPVDGRTCEALLRQNLKTERNPAGYCHGLAAKGGKRREGSGGFCGRKYQRSATAFIRSKKRS
jgi:CRISPR/Cas system endoribonuclease Cas6 (RAMP superfamily)